MVVVLVIEPLKEVWVEECDDGVYISRYMINEPAHKEDEAGYEELELSLRLVLEL